MKAIYAVALASALAIGGVSTAMAQSSTDNATKMQKSEKNKTMTTGSGVNDKLIGSGTPGNNPSTEKNVTNPNAGAQKQDPEAVKNTGK